MADLPDGPITRSKLADLGIRVASAVVLGPVALVLAWIGGHPFAVICAVAGMAMAWEWNGITRRERSDVPTLLGMAGVGGGIAVLVSAGLVPGLLVLFAAAALAQLLSRERSMLAGAAAAALYGGLPTIAMVVLRSDSTTGLVCIFWLFAVVWAGDVAAYFTGRLVGGPKLWRAVSPNKTWSGALGGVVGAVAASNLMLYLAPGASPVPFVLPIVFSAIAQAGDLAESALKRRYHAKDFEPPDPRPRRRHGPPRRARHRGRRRRGARHPPPRRRARRRRADPVVGGA